MMAFDKPVLQNFSVLCNQRVDVSEIPKLRINGNNRWKVSSCHFEDTKGRSATQFQEMYAR